jgi:hypothetical protein
MKKNNILLSVVAIMVVTITSCTMTKRHYAPGYHVEWKNFSKHETPLIVTQPNQTSKNFEYLTVDDPEMRLIQDEPVVTGSLSSNESADHQVLTTLSPKNPIAERENSGWSRHEVGNIHNKAEAYQKSEVDVATSDGVEGVTWLIYLGILVLLALLSIYFFGVGAILSGPIFIAIWTSVVDGEIKWKPVLTSLLLWFLCGLPGFIYDIIWISKNCKGRSLFKKD